MYSIIKEGPMAGEPSKAPPIENRSWKFSINGEQLENTYQLPGITPIMCIHITDCKPADIILDPNLPTSHHTSVHQNLPAPLSTKLAKETPGDFLVFQGIQGFSLTTKVYTGDAELPKDLRPRGVASNNLNTRPACVETKNGAEHTTVSQLLANWQLFSLEKW